MSFDIARITDRGALCHVSPGLLLKLIDQKAPGVGARLRRNPSQDDVTSVLVALGPDDEADALLETLHGINRVASADDAEDLLEAKGIAVNGETIGDALALVALQEPRRFEGVVDLATVRASKASTYTQFELRLKHSIPPPSSSIEKAFGDACAARFAQFGNGPHCEVRNLREGAEVGFLVDHGGFRRTTRDLNEKDEPVTRTGRPVRQDVVMFNSRTGELRILARTEAERIYYAETLGSVWFGDPNSFRPAERYVLDEILSPEYGKVLASLINADVERVTLREVRVDVEDGGGTRIVFASRDALPSLRGRVEGPLGFDGVVAYASFAIVPRVRNGRRLFRLSVYKGSRRRCDAPWTPAAVEDFIEQLSLRRVDR